MSGNATITWKNVAAPNFAASNMLFNKSSDRIAEAFTSGADILKGMHEDKSKRLTGEAEGLIANLTDRQTMAADVANITGQFDSRYLDNSAIAAANIAQRDNLLDTENTEQMMDSRSLDMANQRFQNSIMGDKHAMNMREASARLTKSESDAAKVDMGIKGGEYLMQTDVADSLWVTDENTGVKSYNRDGAAALIMEKVPGMDMGTAIALADQAEDMSGDKRRDAAAALQSERDFKIKQEKAKADKKSNMGNTNDMLSVIDDYVWGSNDESRGAAQTAVNTARFKGMKEKEIQARLAKAITPSWMGNAEFDLAKFNTAP